MARSKRSQKAQDDENNPLCLEKIRGIMGIQNARSRGFINSIPFSLGDVTAGSETELQVAVRGDRRAVDLPLTIEASNYFANISRRAATGDTSRNALTDLEKYLEANGNGIWENSWVRFPIRKLSPLARKVVAEDMLANRNNPGGPRRSDSPKFFFQQAGEEYLRVPVSYLMKLALADVLGTQKEIPSMIKKTGRRLMDHFLSDNTSPETFSFFPVSMLSKNGLGKALAKETSKRFLFSHLLAIYANDKFGLKETGQCVDIYFSPHPPTRQKELNECISDSFYRELFMSPCLSGWEDGESKHKYMHLCHEVLSRSQVNAVAKLREAGIITRNLVVLPTLSNISLANNGTHISIGSLKLNSLLRSGSRDFGIRQEKYLGDLVIKIVEHFLPLFVGTYTAAPYRLDFADFHPEKVLGFLPHELDYTHLRMIWRRWKKKASIKILGKPTTPFGLRSVDRALAMCFRMKGDVVPDFRLIDYMVAPMSTVRSPGLDGTPGNSDRLKQDLADLGIFDTRMSLYMLYRLREYHRMGYSGFEGRHYSLFESLDGDMTEAANLQILVTAIAYQLVLQGAVRHGDIPDDPMVESERRQVFFSSAIGIPTFYVHGSTSNRFLKRILYRATGVRHSRRYSGYLRIYCRQYLLALVKTIQVEGAELVENLGMERTLQNLLRRIQEPTNYAVAERLTQKISETSGISSSLATNANEFNRAAEHYYRNHLKTNYVEEAMNHLVDDIKSLACSQTNLDGEFTALLRWTIGERSIDDVLAGVTSQIVGEEISLDHLAKLIALMLLTIHCEASPEHPEKLERSNDDPFEASVYSEANRVYL